MNRRNRYLLGALAALLIAATPTLYASVLLNDDFTNQAATSTNWTMSASTNATSTVNGGSFTVDNSTGTFIGEYIHDFGANKPANFTLSYVLKSVQGGPAGALFCRQPGEYPSGYLLTTDEADSLVIVYRVTSTVNSSTVSVDRKPIFYKKSLDLNLKPGEANELTVSKNGSLIQISVNGELQGNATDTSKTPYNTGDVSLLLFSKTKATFGKTYVTDEFTPGTSKTEFSDDFNDGQINKYWRQDIKSSSGAAPTISETDGKLQVTSNGSAAYIYVDIDLTDFNAKVEASHVSGKPDAPYGVFLLGEDASQMVKFLIMGGGYYYALKPGIGSYAPKSDDIINGSGKTDILEIKKSEDSPNYEFIVNGKSLDIDFLGQINFNIKGIGLFCQDTLSVAFDNFSVKQNKPTTSIYQNDKKQISRATSPQLSTNNHAFYDMRGRKRYSIATSTPGRAQTRAAGVYINKNGRDVATRKGKVISE